MAPQFFIIGCGKMGSAMLNGWLSASQESDDCYIIIDPYFDKTAITVPYDETKVRLYQSIQEAVKDGYDAPDIMLLSVKPQMMQEALADLGSCNIQHCCFISIAAGLNIARLSEMIGAKTDIKIIRTMPNTPAAIAKGMTAMIGNRYVTSADMAQAKRLLSVCGEVVQLEDEAQLDAVTALSGSGPAYVFLLAELMAKSGVKLGLSETLSRQLATQTVYGAGCLLAQSDEAASILRENVTSKGGTTAAALSVLMDEQGLSPLLEEAMHKAYLRSQELGK